MHEPSNIISMKNLRYFGFALLMIMAAFSCNKDDEILIESDIVGSWETTNFQVSGCTDSNQDVEMRTCDFSEFDDVECSMMEFRPDGLVITEEYPLEKPLKYSLVQDKLTISDPNDDEVSLQWSYKITEDTMALTAIEFNSPGCILNVYFIRTN